LRSKKAKGKSQKEEGEEEEVVGKRARVFGTGSEMGFFW
jgi:hypothetical protein